MRYFVLANDGNKYGPADVATLNGWIAEGRLVATQMLEDETTGARLPAGTVPGLMFAAPGMGAPGMGAPGMGAPGAGPADNPFATPSRPENFPPGPTNANYYPRTGGFVGDDGSGDLTQAFVFGALGLACCPFIFSFLGLAAANRAEMKGNPGAKGAKILNYIGLAFAAVAVVFWILAFVLGLVSGVSN